MHDNTTERIRNVVLVGHSGAGKTTLAEALLARAGPMPRAGQGRRRHEHARHRAGGGQAADQSLSLDARSVRVDAARRPDVQGQPARHARLPGLRRRGRRRASPSPTSRCSSSARSRASRCRPRCCGAAAAELGMPRMVFVNKEDKDRADFHRVLDAAHARGSAPGSRRSSCRSVRRRRCTGSPTCCPRTALEYDGRRHAPHRPAARPTSPTRSTSCTTRSSRRSSPATTSSSSATSPATCPSVADARAHARPRGARLARVPRAARVRRSPASASTGSPTSSASSDRRRRIARSPSSPATATVPGRRRRLRPAAAATCSRRSPTRSSASSRCSRCCRARSPPTTTCVNSRTGADERLHGLFTLRGKEQTAADRGSSPATSPRSPSSAGTHTGDTLAPKGTPVRVAPVDRAEPSQLRRGDRAAHPEPTTTSSAARCSGCRRRIPALRVDRVERDAPDRAARRRRHARRGRARAAARASSASTSTPSTCACAYRETVDRHGRRRRARSRSSRGGHGQFAIANLRVAPLERGAGFEFDDSIVGGAIPRNYIPAVQKGVEETMVAGRRARLPRRRRARRVLRRQVPLGRLERDGVQDRRRARASSEAMAAAGVGGARADLAAAGRPCPIAHQGDVMGDISSRRGRVQGTETGDARRAGDHRARADERADPLRRRPALDDRRPRPVHACSTTTTTCCRPTSSRRPPRRRRAARETGVDDVRDRRDEPPRARAERDPHRRRRAGGRVPRARWWPGSPPTPTSSTRWSRRGAIRGSRPAPPRCGSAARCSTATSSRARREPTVSALVVEALVAGDPRSRASGHRRPRSGHRGAAAARRRAPRRSLVPAGGRARLRTTRAAPATR